jgi:hypothetical protein
MHPESGVMITESTESSSGDASRQSIPADAATGSTENEKQTISPAERWLLVRENAYARAQKRCFMGGNPFEDWKSAEQEIDAQYKTGVGGEISLADSAEIAERVKKVLKGQGLGHMSVDALLRQHSECMDKLATFNRSVIESTSELAQKQTSLAQDSLTEAVKTLRSVTQGKFGADGMAKQAELSMKAVENAMSHIRTLAEAMTGMGPGGKKEK